jgi:hypothetical protein
MMMQIKLQGKVGKGLIAIIDDCDYDVCSNYRWMGILNGARTTVYAVNFYKDEQTGKTMALFMHHLIMGKVQGKEIDHIDHNGLNNTRGNLRFATRTENMRNMNPKRGCSSKFKGVSFNIKLEKWQALIRIGRKLVHLGYYLREEDAAVKYDIAALEHFGKFAKINFDRSRYDGILSPRLSLF